VDVAGFEPVLTKTQNGDAPDTRRPQNRTESSISGDTPLSTGDTSDTSKQRQKDATSHENYAVFRTENTSQTPDADLSRVMAAWPKLPEAMRAAILTMVESTAEKRK